MLIKKCVGLSYKLYSLASQYKCKVSVELYTLQGKLVQEVSNEQSAQTISIDTNQLPNGVFLVKVISNGNTLNIQKLVIAQ